MKDFTLVLGGARSGKSALAQRLALDKGGVDVLYVATAEALDDEMRLRIARHRAERPNGWRTVETPIAPAAGITAGVGSARAVLLDCVAVLASNLILALGDAPDPERAEQTVLAETDRLLAAYRSGSASFIVVTNEVGLGLVPPYPLGRLYRDVLGRANQRLAQAADQVLFLVAGLPMKLK